MNAWKAIRLRLHLSSMGWQFLLTYRDSYKFSLEYQKGPDNAAADTLSRPYRSSTPTCSTMTSSSTAGVDCSLLRVFSSFCVSFSSLSSASSRCGSALALRTHSRHQASVLMCGVVFLPQLPLWVHQ